MKRPRSLKECKTDDEVQDYIIANDGLSDEDWAKLEPVELGAEDDLGDVIPVRLDLPTCAAIRKLARKRGKLTSALLREWIVEGIKREQGPKKVGSTKSKPKRKAAG